jgi:hypothetical protein
MEVAMYSLDQVRHILTVENEINRLLPEGPTDSGTEVLVLRKNHAGYYEPCVAVIEHITATGRFTVSLWQDRSERVTVSRKAVLWKVPADVMTIGRAYDMLPMSERTLLKHFREYPFELRNDLGEACTYRVIHGGKELGIVVYYKGRKLVCHGSKAA